MRKILLSLIVLMACVCLNAQIMEVSTLKSKGLNGPATKVEVNQFNFVEEKGLMLAQSDVETYDEKGRLVGIDRKIHASGQIYRYTYKLSKKGLLEEEKIVNAVNNETVRITTYAYKKGKVVSTTQVQGTVTFVKNYSYNKKGFLIQMEAIENGTSKGVEIYEVDEKGRRTLNSQKLPTDEEAKTLSTFKYETQDNLEFKTEIRTVNGVQYEIVGTKDINTNRNLKETTNNLSDSKSGFNNLTYVDDVKGSWVKGEIIDNQFGRSKLILKKITYTDGTSTGRIEMKPEDDRARYYRQNSKFQVIINGKIETTGTALDILDSKDRLAYNASRHTWVLMKGYDAETYQTTWHESLIVTNTKDDVIWVHNSTGIDMYQNGKKLKSSTTSNYGDYSEYATANTNIIYFGGDIRKTMVVQGIDKTTDLGQVKVAELTEEHNYWVKSSDTTYVAVGYGKYLKLQGQSEDGDGDNLVTVRVGDGSYFYLLPKFRERFDNGKPGDIYPSTYLQDPLSAINESGTYGADFSSFKYDNLKNSQYSLKTVDGRVVHGLAMPTTKTQDDRLMTYFPLTNEYLRLDGYYTKSDDRDFLDETVSVLLKGSKDAYYLYNNAKSIAFYKSGAKIGPHKYGSHKLDQNTLTYGAVVYDSTFVSTYGMNYDLSKGDRMGPMKKLPYNQSSAYLLKLENGNWIVFEKGVKVGNYDYSVINEESAVHFFKNKTNGEINAYRFDKYKEAKSGDFISAVTLTGAEASRLSAKLQVNPLRPVEKEEAPEGAPNTYQKGDKSYWVWDENGDAIVNYLQFFGNLGTDDLLVRDTVLNITYELEGYFTADKSQGKSSIVVRPEDNKVLKWGEGKVTFLLQGELKTKVKRVYINNDESTETWSELVYDPTTQKTYKMTYPSKNGYYLGKGELLPTGDDALVLTKLKEGRFSIVRHGNLDRRDDFKSDSFEGDLIYWTEGENPVRYRFKGFEKAETYNLFYPEILTANQLEELKAKGK